MKYLEDGKLTQLTSMLTDAELGGTNCRVINGRMEVYSMKRAGSDKKYAHALGEVYAQEMDDELETYQHFMHRGLSKTASLPRGGRKRSQSVGARIEVTKRVKHHRKRASSFDGPTPKPKPSSVRRFISDPASSSISQSALGDFHETGTRKLMTDLILTLNASFPDYDFANVRPAHFVKIPASTAVNRINERLSELAGVVDGNLLSTLWNAIENSVTLAESTVYCFSPPARSEEDDPLAFLTQTLAGEGCSSLWCFNYFFVNKHLKRILLFSCVETLLPQGDEIEVDSFVTKGMGYNTDASDVDFDLDPAAADVAGGIPVATR